MSTIPLLAPLQSSYWVSSVSETTDIEESLSNQGSQFILASDNPGNVGAFDLISHQLTASGIQEILTMSKLVLWVIIRRLWLGWPYYENVSPKVAIVVCLIISTYTRCQPDRSHQLP